MDEIYQYVFIFIILGSTCWFVSLLVMWCLITGSSSDCGSLHCKGNISLQVVGILRTILRHHVNAPFSLPFQLMVLAFVNDL